MKTIASGVVALTLVAAATTAAADRTLVVAHRGGAALWPENSLRAFRGALALGVDALELDVHLTRDGEVVVLHDPTLERTTTSSGAVRDRTFAELRDARLKARDGTITDERPPRLADVLDLARASRVEVLPEIKVDAKGESYPGIEEKVLRLVREREMLARVTIQAFQAETIVRLRALEPGVHTMLLVSRRRLDAERASPSTAIRWARDVGATDVGMDFRIIDAATVAAARVATIRLSAWTVNEESDMRRMRDLGVPVVMSDRPDVLRRVASER